jgi:hypothetical protein
MNNVIVSKGTKTKHFIIIISFFIICYFLMNNVIVNK